MKEKKDAEKKNSTEKTVQGLLGPIKDRSHSFSVLGTAGVMGLHMVTGPVAGCAVGWFVDERLGSWPVWASTGLILGVIAGFYNVWRDAKRIVRYQEKHEQGTQAQNNAGGKLPKHTATQAQAQKSSVTLPASAPGRVNPHRPKQPEYRHKDNTSGENHD